jgi:undecaprenyl pyrophosphate phosphatase UppP
MWNFIVGFIIGIFFGGMYVNWFIRSLKKQGYVTFDATEKLKDELRQK